MRRFRPLSKLLLDVLLGIVMGGTASGVAINLFASPPRHGFCCRSDLCLFPTDFIHPWGPSGIAATATSGLCLAVFLFEPVGHIT